MTRITKTLIIAALAIASTLNAEVVYLSKNGKTYHARKDCIALTRSREVLTTDDAAAMAHGLRPCGICHRAKKHINKDTNSWAQGAAK